LLTRGLSSCFASPSERASALNVKIATLNYNGQEYKKQVAPKDEGYQANQIWCEGIGQIEDDASERRRDRSQRRR